MVRTPVSVHSTPVSVHSTPVARGSPLSPAINRSVGLFTSLYCSVVYFITLYCTTLYSCSKSVQLCSRGWPASQLQPPLKVFNLKLMW